MKTALSFLLIFSLWVSAALAEGPWNVNGHIFTELNAKQKGREITISGKVSDGTVKNPLQAILHVQNDEGQIYKTVATVPHYSGKDEIFESKFYAWEKAKWWKIVEIESN